MNDLLIENLSYIYRNSETKAVSNFSVELSNGVYGILGPNGAGKSTLFKLLTGEIIPQSGYIHWNHLSISEQWLEYKLNLGYMPQQQQLYPNMTIYQFLNYVAVLKKISKKLQKKQVLKVSEMTGIKNIIFKKWES